ncbi:unnamed protein product [Adineta ricciae]|uniref:Apple domain-containing protein n=1 Tax=Adineta ricciae TaxID=249248 RepID=A0A816DSA2_ADIRI|nr:unnamed protein product [Adineta ricciae]
MPNITCYLILILGCLVLSVFSGNYTYYNGFAYISSNQTVLGQTLNTCVCQCLLANGCSALTFYNSSGLCTLVTDMNITESEVSLTNGATLLLVNAQLVQ